MARARGREEAVLIYIEGIGRKRAAVTLAFGGSTIGARREKARTLAIVCAEPGAGDADDRHCICGAKMGEGYASAGELSRKPIRRGLHPTGLSRG